MSSIQNSVFDLRLLIPSRTLIVLLACCCVIGCISAVSAGDVAPGLTPTQRLETEHFKAAHEARLRLADEREKSIKLVPVQGVYEDYRAVIGVHAGTDDPNALGEAAKKAGVTVVMLTEPRDSRQEPWHGIHDGVLFLSSTEDNDGVLHFSMFGNEPGRLHWGELRFLPPLFDRADIAGFSGMQILRPDKDKENLREYLKNSMADPAVWRTLCENFTAYPDEFLAAHTSIPSAALQQWNRELQDRALAGIANSAVAQNLTLKGVNFDPYENGFRQLTTHVLARELTETAVCQALGAGHAYLAHDWLCDPTGFVFTAFNRFGIFPMGDAVPYPITGGTNQILAFSPVKARLKLIHNGKTVKETVGVKLSFDAPDTGAYRLEAWLSIDGEERPWVYSNPVYLQTLTETALRTQTPTFDLSPNVTAQKDIVYAGGKPEDEPKHKLDLYRPKDKQGAPVFFFIHGGAWKTGDRAMYVPLANFFASKGILTVVPSYRLAPKNAHPAQVEDAAAAFAWTVQHVAEYGGDPSRIYVGGHSAGGHLAALLVLDEKYLKIHGLSSKNIRGVAALSGVYNIVAIGDGLSFVFGKEKPGWKDASPLFHIGETAPPFLVSYCEWDYPTLPAQAREFYAALRTAGIGAKLIYVPHEDHISEMLAVPRDDDPTAKAVLELIK